MKSHLIILKLTLDELGIDFDIDNIEDRKLIQKVIYCVQRMVPLSLGYHFGWYKMGPYSPELAKDYYDLNFILTAGQDELQGKTLRSDIRNKLQKIKPILDVPENVELPRADWMELIASVDFILHINGGNENTTKEIIREKKTKLASYVDQAIRALKTVYKNCEEDRLQLQTHS